MATSIFEIRQSHEEGRPYFPRTGTANRDEASRVNYRILRAKHDDIDDWSPWELFCDEPGQTASSEWDYYSFESTSGLLSQRAIDELGVYLQRCFVPLPSTIDGTTYYFLHPRAPIDCLDVDASEILYFDDSTDIMRIKKYVFNTDDIVDPLIFTTPQEPWVLFTTESIPEIIKKAKLKGFRFLKLT